MEFSAIYRKEEEAKAKHSMVYGHREEYAALVSISRSGSYSFVKQRKSPQPKFLSVSVQSQNGQSVWAPIIWLYTKKKVAAELQLHSDPRF